MNRNLKIVITVSCSLLVIGFFVGLTTYFVFPEIAKKILIGTNPTRSAEIGRDIADYAIPSGYKESHSMDIIGVRAVLISPNTSSDGGMVLLLMQFSDDTNLSQLEKEQKVNEVLARQNLGGKVQMQIVGTRDEVIRGQPVTLTINEGTHSRGYKLRQAICVFNGKNGSVLFLATGATSTWDEKLVEAFLASIQ